MLGHRASFVLLLFAIAGMTAMLTSPVRSQAPAGAVNTVIIDGHEAAAGEVIVKMRPSARAADQRDRIATTAEADQLEALGTTGAHRVRSRRFGPVQLMARLQQDPDVEYVEPNWVLRSSVTPNDPSFSNLWGLFNTGSNTFGGPSLAGADIDAPAAWNITTGTRSVVVGVIDTGIDYTHQDLVSNIWSAPSAFSLSLGGQTITCAAGTHGFNAISRTCNPMDDAATPHGTHVAGTIGASGNDGVGIAGVNWATSLMGLKFLDANGSGLTSNAVLAIQFAIQARTIFGAAANVRVLSNSWGGGGYSQSLVDAITAANNAGMLFVVAAGNNGTNIDATPDYPASYSNPNILAVAATDNQDALAAFSNYGASTVHVAAPGVAIYSTGRNNSYLGLNGTSMATPHVSGAAALLLAACSASTSELRAQLLGTVDVVPGLSGKVSTGGRLNVGRAVSTCPTPNISSVSLTANKAAPQGTGATVTFTANAAGGQAPYQFRWAVWDGSTWTTYPWGTSNSFAWTPTASNSSYKVEARARSAWNSGPPESVRNMDFPIYTPISGVSLSADKPSPQGTGRTVTFSAAASGGQAPYQFRWAVWDGATWTVYPWGSSTTFAWTPTAANTSYKVEARARSAWNSGSPEAVRNVDFPIYPSVSSVSVTADKTAPQGTNTTINFSTSASGGQAPYQFRWAVWDGTTWTVSPWATNTTFAWTPTSPNASYKVESRARSAWNSGAPEAVRSVDFPVYAKISSVSISANTTAPQPAGTSITFTAAAAGGVAPYQFRFAVWDGTTWAVTPWGSSSTYVWTPTVPNTQYKVEARARSAWNAGAPEAVRNIDFPIQ